MVTIAVAHEVSSVVKGAQTLAGLSLGILRRPQLRSQGRMRICLAKGWSPTPGSGDELLIPAISP